MPNYISEVEWKQNRMRLSDVFFKVNLSSGSMIEFLLEEKLINYIFEKRDEEIEVHLKLDGMSVAETFRIDFSKLKYVKAVYPLLQQGLDLPKLIKQTTTKAGSYSIFHKGSKMWLGKDGWGRSQTSFDIVPEKHTETFLRVSIAPDAAKEAGAQWRVDEGEWQNSDAVLPLGTGKYHIEFVNLAGWATPKKKQVHIVEGLDENISVEYFEVERELTLRQMIPALKIFICLFLLGLGLYYINKPAVSGAFVANISPPEVAEKGGKWRVEDGDGNGAWQESGTAVTLPTGNHIVEFMPIDGWQHPRMQKITINASETAQIDASYSKMVTVNITPCEAVQSGAQWKASGQSDWHSSGEKIVLSMDDPSEITFKEIPDWITPANRRLGTEEHSIEIAYEKVDPPLAQTGRSLTIHIHPAAANLSGARWKIEGPGSWNVSGDTLHGLIDIPYTVIFKQASGWQKPHNLEVAFDGTDTIVKEGHYNRLN